MEAILCETYHKLPEELDQCDIQRLLINVDLLGTYRTVQKMKDGNVKGLSESESREVGELLELDLLSKRNDNI